MSPIIQIKAAQAPFKINTITIMNQSMYKIIIGWTPPHNAGDPIIDYRVYWD